MLGIRQQLGDGPVPAGRPHPVPEVAFAAALTATIAAADTLSVADVGSFHVGGRAVSLSGLPTKDVVFTAGSAPIKVDPNGDFEVEQMYVQYVKLAQPKAKYPLLLWHGGGLTSKRVTGLIMTQILPFADPRALKVYGQFERGVYEALKAG